MGACGREERLGIQGVDVPGEKIPWDAFRKMIYVGAPQLTQRKGRNEESKQRAPTHT